MIFLQTYARFPRCNGESSHDAGIWDPLSPQCITNAAMCAGAISLGSYASDGNVPKVSARFMDFDGQYHDKQPWREKPRTYDEVNHVSIHDDNRIFIQNPDGSNGGLMGDLVSQ